jgi:hypothetical protein
MPIPVGAGLAGDARRSLARLGAALQPIAGKAGSHRACLKIETNSIKFIKEFIFYL